jgi:hypothetical protein
MHLFLNGATNVMHSFDLLQGPVKGYKTTHVQQYENNKVHAQCIHAQQYVGSVGVFHTCASSLDSSTALSNCFKNSICIFFK